MRLNGLVPQACTHGVYGVCYLLELFPFSFTVGLFLETVRGIFFFLRGTCYVYCNEFFPHASLLLSQCVPWTSYMESSVFLKSQESRQAASTVFNYFQIDSENS